MAMAMSPKARKLAEQKAAEEAAKPVDKKAAKKAELAAKKKALEEKKAAKQAAKSKKAEAKAQKKSLADATPEEEAFVSVMDMDKPVSQQQGNSEEEYELPTKGDMAVAAGGAVLKAKKGLVKGTVKGTASLTKAAVKGTVKGTVAVAKSDTTSSVLKATVKGSVSATGTVLKGAATGAGKVLDASGLGKVSDAVGAAGSGLAAVGNAAGKFTLRMLQDDPDMDFDENGYLIPDIGIDDLMGEVYAHSENEMAHKSDVECEAAAIVSDNIMASLLNQFEVAIEQWDLTLEMCNLGMNSQNHNDDIIEHIEHINELKYDVYITAAQRVEEFISDMRECEKEMHEAQHLKGVAGATHMKEAKMKKKERLMITREEFLAYEQNYLEKLDEEVLLLQQRHPLADYFLDYWKSHDRMCGNVYNSLMDLDKQIDKEIERMPLNVLCEYRRELTTEAFSHGVGRMPDFDVPSMIASHTFLHCPEHDDAFWTYRVDEETWRHAHDDVPTKPADGEAIVALHLPPDPHAGKPKDMLMSLIEDAECPQSLGSDQRLFRTADNQQQLAALQEELSEFTFKELKNRALANDISEEEIAEAEAGLQKNPLKAMWKIANPIARSADRLERQQEDFQHLTGWVQMPDVEGNYVDLFCTVSEEDLIFWETDTYLSHADPVLVLKLAEITGTVLTTDRADLEPHPDRPDERPAGIDEEGQIIKSVIKLVTEYTTWRMKFNPKYPEVTKIWWRELCGASKYAKQQDAEDMQYARHFNRRLFPRNGQAEMPGEMPIWKKVEGMALATKDSSGSALKTTAIAVLRGTDAAAGKVFAGTTAGSKMMIKGSLAATKATAKGTLAGGYLLTQNALKKSVLYTPSLLGASVDGARRARKLMAIAAMGGADATDATLEMSVLAGEQVLKGTGFLLKKTLKGTVATSILAANAAKETAKAAATTGQAGTKLGLKAAVAGAKQSAEMAGEGKEKLQQMKEDRAIEQQRKALAEAQGEHQDLKDMKDRVDQRAYDATKGEEAMNAIEAEGQAALEAQGLTGGSEDLSGMTFQQKRLKLQEISTKGKKGSLKKFLGGQLGYEHPHPMFTLTDEELATMDKKEQIDYKRATLRAKKETREEAEKAKKEELAALPFAEREARIAADAAKEKAAEVAAKAQAKVDKKAAKQAAKADKKDAKKKGKKGLSVEVPEGEAAGDMPSKDTEPAVVNGGFDPLLFDSTGKELSAKDKKKAALAAKKKALEEKKAQRAAKKGKGKGKGGTTPQPEPEPEPAPGAVGAVATAASGGEENPLAPVVNGGFDPLLFDSTGKELSAKDKKKAALAAKRKALEEKKAARKSAKKGKKDDKKPSKDSDPVKTPQPQPEPEPEVGAPVVPTPGAVATPAIEVEAPVKEMSAKEKKKAELAAKKKALEQKKAARKSAKQGKKDDKKDKKTADVPATPATPATPAPAAPSTPAVPTPQAAAPIEVETPVKEMSAKEKKKAELAAKKKALEEKKAARKSGKKGSPKPDKKADKKAAKQAEKDQPKHATMRNPRAEAEAAKAEELAALAAAQPFQPASDTPTPEEAAPPPVLSKKEQKKADLAAKKAALEAKKAERAAAKDKAKGKKGKGKGKEEEEAEAPKQPSLTARCYCCQKQFARSTLDANEGLCRPACLTEWDERNAALPMDQRQNRPIRHSTYQQELIGAQANKVSATSILNRLDEHKQDLQAGMSDMMVYAPTRDRDKIETVRNTLTTKDQEGWDAQKAALESAGVKAQGNEDADLVAHRQEELAKKQAAFKAKEAELKAKEEAHPELAAAARKSKGDKMKSSLQPEPEPEPEVKLSKKEQKKKEIAEKKAAVRPYHML